MTAEFETKYSGRPVAFETGAQRDNRDGKGRYDLISPHLLRSLYGVSNIDSDPENAETALRAYALGEVLLALYEWATDPQLNIESLADAIHNLAWVIAIDEGVDQRDCPWFHPLMLKRLAGVYERGAVHHGDRNWERGIPYSRLLDSAVRHTVQCALGMTDEDHAAQAIWNVAAILHFVTIGRTDLDDLPVAGRRTGGSDPLGG